MDVQMFESGDAMEVQMFESGDALEWRRWRQHVEQVMEKDQVSHDRANMIIKISMKINSRAELLTGDIMPLPEETYMDFLDRLQSRFFPHPIIAQHAFDISKQMKDESLGRFHARLRDEFFFAYPNNPNPNVDPYLIFKFQKGLRDSSVKKHVMAANPKEYNECLLLAESINT